MSLSRSNLSYLVLSCFRKRLYYRCILHPPTFYSLFTFLCALTHLFYSIITLPPVFPPWTLPLGQNLPVNSQGDIELRQCVYRFFPKPWPPVLEKHELLNEIFRGLYLQCDGQEGYRPTWRNAQPQTAAVIGWIQSLPSRGQSQRFAELTGDAWYSFIFVSIIST